MKTTWCKACRINKNTTFGQLKEYLRLITSALDQKLDTDSKIELNLFKEDSDTIFSISGFQKGEKIDERV